MKTATMKTTFAEKSLHMQVYSKETDSPVIPSQSPRSAT